MESHIVTALCFLGLAVIMAVNQYYVRAELADIAEQLKALREHLSALR